VSGTAFGGNVSVKGATVSLTFEEPRYGVVKRIVAVAHDERQTTPQNTTGISERRGIVILNFR
jgi:hypothetical protein